MGIAGSWAVCAEMGRESIVTIGLMHMEFSIPGSRSLKEKRRAMNSLKSLLRSRYNASVAEVGMKDKLTGELKF